MRDGIVTVQRVNKPYPEAEIKGNHREYKRPGAYLVAVPETGHIYAGSSTAVDKRINGHVSDLRNGIHDYPNVQKAYDSKQEIEIKVRYTENLEIATAIEQIAVNTGVCINKRTLDVTRPTLGIPCSEYNIQRIKETHTGKIVSEETRQKLSEANKGKTLTEEQKAHLSRINTGKKLSPETIEKIRQTTLGKTRPPEVGRKISEAKKGKGFPEVATKAFLEQHCQPVICQDVEYKSFTAAAQALGVTDVTIRNRARNPNFPDYFIKDKENVKETD